MQKVINAIATVVEGFGMDPMFDVHGDPVPDEDSDDRVPNAAVGEFRITGVGVIYVADEPTMIVTLSDGQRFALAMKPAG